MSSPKSDHANAIFEAWEVLLQYRWRFIVPAFLVAAAVLVTSLFLPRKYKSEAIFERRTDAVLTEVTSRGGSNASVRLQDPRSTVIEQIKGGPAIDALIEGIERNPHVTSAVDTGVERSILRQAVARHVLINWDIQDEGLERIRVHFTGDDPQVAAAVVNTLVRNYLDKAQHHFELQLQETAGFYRQEMSRHRLAVEKAEAEVLAYEIAHADLLPDTPNNIQTRITEESGRLADLQAERESLLSQVASLESSLASEPKSIESLVRAKNPELIRLQEKRQELDDQLVKATRVLKMTDAHPEVVALQEQITAIDEAAANTDQVIVAERQETVNPKRRELELRLEEARTQSTSVESQIQKVEAELASLTGRSGRMFDVRRDYRRLERKVEDAVRQVGFWEDNLRRIELALTADAGDKGVQFEFIRPATAHVMPVSPNFAQVLMGAMIMGLLAGALNVFFTHRTNESFGDGERAARAVDLQLFGAVSEIITGQHRRVRRLRSMILYPANAVIMGGILLALVTLLYVDLRQPQVMSAWKSSFDAPAVDPALRSTRADEPSHNESELP